MKGFVFYIKANSGLRMLDHLYTTWVGGLGIVRSRVAKLLRSLEI